MKTLYVLHETGPCAVEHEDPHAQPGRVPSRHWTKTPILVQFKGTALKGRYFVSDDQDALRPSMRVFVVSNALHSPMKDVCAQSPKSGEMGISHSWAENVSTCRLEKHVHRQESLF